MMIASVEASTLVQRTSTPFANRARALAGILHASSQTRLVFEPLAEKKHRERIRTLNITFGTGLWELTCLNYSQFFKSPDCPQLTSLRWDDWSAPRFVTRFPFLFAPTLRSLTFRGPSGYNQFLGLSNLTSFTWEAFCNSREIDFKDFQVFLLNNRSVETLSLSKIKFKGNSDRDPVTLPNLKLCLIRYPHDDPRTKYSTVFRIPALQHLSSFHSSLEEDCGFYPLAIRATAGDLVSAFQCRLWTILGAWEDVTGYAKPIIQHVRFECKDALGCESGGEYTPSSGDSIQDIFLACVRLYVSANPHDDILPFKALSLQTDDLHI